MIQLEYSKNLMDSKNRHSSDVPKKKKLFGLTESPQSPQSIDLNASPPPENLTIEKQLTIIRMLKCFITCCDCKCVFFILNFFVLF